MRRVRRHLGRRDTLTTATRARSSCTKHLDVTIEVGPPYTKPVPFTAWNGN